MGLVQGVTELFPVSSLGHGVILPGLLGWTDLVSAQTRPQSFFLAFLVGLHVGTAIGLFVYYRRDWVRLVSAFFGTLRNRRAETPDERLIWMLIFATIPIGIVGLLAEKRLRDLFAKPLDASIFLIANGLLLLGGELGRRRTLAARATGRRGAHAPLAISDDEAGGFRRLDQLSYARAV